MRDTFADWVTVRDWIVLYAEFEAEALRNECIRKNFVELHRQTVRDGEEFLRELLKTCEIILSMKPNEFIAAMLSFPHGLAVKQKILGTELSQKSTRTLIFDFFDRLISVA
jgi:mannose-6-phosphate isomerase class I